MKQRTWAEIRSLFEQAVALEPASRQALLQRPDTMDPDVRREVERLLAEDESTDGFLEPPVPGGLTLGSGLPLTPGSRVGPFEILRVLASGGMGTVYEAMQAAPRRVVALKTLRHGLSSESLRRRFAFEAEVLGNLHHPGIAQVYDAGTHDEGSSSYPYFAMEYVEDARDLLEFSRERRLTIRERIELFAAVCDAVQHGHSKGVVHRDLKPSNVLIDRDGRPKVIDFGVARAIAPELSSGAETLDGQIVGTLHYISPEQLTTGDVDTRSDVYSLGCVLHELLVGRPPHELGDEPFAEVTRLVTEVDPPRPAGIPADLAWIVMKCLAKEPPRRYSTAAELAADLRRFGRHEAVIASPPTTGYRLLKLARRNRVVLVATVLVFAALGVGLLRARAEAESAKRALELARREAEKAEGVGDFLRSMLTSVGPLAQGIDTRIIDALQEAEQTIERDLGDQPEARALVENVFAETYSELRLFEPAREHLAVALAFVEDREPDDPLRIDVLTNQARLDILTGNYEVAEQALREVEGLALARHGPDHRATLRIRGTLAELLLILGQYDEAERRYDSHLGALERFYGPTHGEVLGFLGGRALVWQRQGRMTEARDELERVLDLCVEHVRPGSFRIVNARANLATHYRKMGDLELAEPVFRDILEDVRLQFGDEHAFTVISILSLAATLRDQERYRESLPLYQEAHRLGVAVFGEGPHVEEAAEGLAQARAHLGEEAVPQPDVRGDD